jgi:DNA-binding HxlR family transcriptional regulator
MKKNGARRKCRSKLCAEIIGRKWVSLILRDLANGPQRFGQLEHSVKASRASSHAPAGVGK